MEDGVWRTLEEIAERISIRVDELASYCEKGSKVGIIDYDVDSGRVRLKHEFIDMILRLEAENEKEATWKRRGVGTAIVPAGKRFQVQSVCVRNQTEKDLEIAFAFDNRLREIVISMS